MKDIGFLQIIELIGPTNKLAGRKAPRRQMAEKNIIRHQPRDGDNLPAGLGFQNIIDATKIGYLVWPHGQGLHPFDKFATGVIGQEPRLALKKGIPDGVIFGGV